VAGLTSDGLSDSAHHPGALAGEPGSVGRRGPTAHPGGGLGTSEGPAVAGRGEGQRRVRIYLNGHLLPSKTSVVQSLVNNVTHIPRSHSHSHVGMSRSGAQAREDQSTKVDRFLAWAEEGASGSEADVADRAGSSGGPNTAGVASMSSPRHFCGAIWGRVHTMSYEFVTDEARSRPECCEFADGVSNVEGEGSVLDSVAAAAMHRPLSFVATDFDALIQRHMRVVGGLASFQRRQGQQLSVVSIGADQEDTPGAEGDRFTPRSADDHENMGSGSRALGFAAEQGALPIMLQLISAFHNVCDYMRSSQGTLSEIPAPDGDIFHCGALTAALLRQLSDPLAVCTGSVPSWCIKLVRRCPYLFPYGVRRILHHSCNLGLSRALHHVQQRALAQHAHSQEMQRRLEGELAVASIPRQKVRISRQRILESAVKVMNLYGSGNAILEVEYVGEVGTGSGPTLEFYAQVADILRTSEPRLFRHGVPGGMLFPSPQDPEWLRRAEDQAAQQILERFRLLGQVVAKCILDGRLVDMQLHPLFWRAALSNAPFTQQSLREVDPELFASISRMRDMDSDVLAGLCVDFSLPGHPHIDLKPGGASLSLTSSNLQEYISRVAEVSLVTAVAPQIQAFCSAFRTLLPLEACAIWSEKELASIIVGASVKDNACWSLDHLGAHIKAQHGYTADSRCFRDLLALMANFSVEDRRKFLTFATGAPSLPIGGFAGLKPPLTVVKKEAPPAPLTTDQFMPSVMTCANYLKLPEYSSAEVLKQKLELAMREGQSAFLLS